MPGDSSRTRERSAYVGWWVSAIVLVVIFAAAATLWFIFHPV